MFDGKIVVSIAAGITLDQLHDLIGGLPNLILRAIPNMPCRVQQGVIAISSRYGDYGLGEGIGRKLFESLGHVLFIDEKHMDVVTALGGSGPAFAW